MEASINISLLLLDPRFWNTTSLLSYIVHTSCACNRWTVRGLDAWQWQPQLQCFNLGQPQSPDVALFAAGYSVPWHRGIA